MVDPSLLERAYAAAFPGREAAARNEILRLIAEALRTPQRRPGMLFHQRRAQPIVGVDFIIPVGNNEIGRCSAVLNAESVPPVP